MRDLMAKTAVILLRVPEGVDYSKFRDTVVGIAQQLRCELERLYVTEEIDKTVSALEEEALDYKRLMEAAPLTFPMKATSDLN